MASRITYVLEFEPVELGTVAAQVYRLTMCARLPEPGAIDPKVLMALVQVLMAKSP